jgi:hypothetical protein
VKSKLGRLGYDSLFFTGVFFGYLLKSTGFFYITLSRINPADFLIIFDCILRNFTGQGKIELQNGGRIQTGRKT